MGPGRGEEASEPGDAGLQELKESAKRRPKVVPQSSVRPISNFQRLHQVLSKYQDGWIFRGHSSAEWKLRPKVGRSPNCVAQERSLFESWKLRAVEYLALRPNSDWEWLAIAQHHGLATRLLDWTTNPLNALWFAVCGKETGEAVLFAAKFNLRFGQSIDRRTDGVAGSHPMTFEGLGIYRPSGVVPRIIRQSGLFTSTAHRTGSS